MLNDLDTRCPLVRERAELLARDMQASRQRESAHAAPLASRLIVAAGQLTFRPRLTH